MSAGADACETCGGKTVVPAGFYGSSSEAQTCRTCGGTGTKPHVQEAASEGGENPHDLTGS